MKVNLPKLQNLADVRKYLMVIESLELNKLNNAISVNATAYSQVKAIQNLKSMKNYYGELTEFLIKKQSESRMDEFEECYVSQIEEFLQFWQQTMIEFKEVGDAEIERALEKNEELKNDLNEMLEKTLGFRPPLNALFNNLVAIRKIAVKLKNNESTQYLNFDYFKKHNIKINQDWVRDRKLLIISKLENFEKKLESCLVHLKDKLNNELWKLHGKRLKHFDRLMAKYNKIKVNVEELNSKEIQHLRKLKKFFLLKHSIPFYYHDSEVFLNGIQESGKPIPNDSNENMFDFGFDLNEENTEKDDEKNHKKGNKKDAKGVKNGSAEKEKGLKKDKNEVKVQGGNQNSNKKDGGKNDHKGKVETSESAKKAVSDNVKRGSVDKSKNQTIENVKQGSNDEPKQAQNEKVLKGGKALNSTKKNGSADSRGHSQEVGKSDFKKNKDADGKKKALKAV